MSENGTVLLVDQSIDNLGPLRLALEDAGFRIIEARSGDEVPCVLAREKLDLVILDMGMPAMDGCDTCRRITTHEGLGDLPVVIVGDAGDGVGLASGFAAGAIDFVARPLCLAEMLCRVRVRIAAFRRWQQLVLSGEQSARALIESEAHLRRLSESLLRVREEDRRHFARELHDELGQNLIALRIDINALASDLGTANERISMRLAMMDSVLDHTVDSVRRICEDLRPGMLDDLGLEAALASYVRRFSQQHGIPCDLALTCDDFGLDEPMSTAIFRIVQESLTNIARHAEASYVEIKLEARDEHLQLLVADDGRGMPSEADPARKTFGIVGIRERVKLLGGNVSISSVTGRGTRVAVTVPISRGGAA